jgi:hypothetical protein
VKTLLHQLLTNATGKTLQKQRSDLTGALILLQQLKLYSDMPASSRLHHGVRAWYDSLPGINSSDENKMVPQPAATQTRCDSVMAAVKPEALAAVKREPEPAAALTYGSAAISGVKREARADVEIEALAGVKLELLADGKHESLAVVKSEPCKRRKLQSGLVKVLSNQLMFFKSTSRFTLTAAGVAIRLAAYV